MKYIKKFESLALTIGTISGIFIFEKIRQFLKKEYQNQKLVNLVSDILQDMKYNRKNTTYKISDFPDYYRLYNDDIYIKVFKNENKLMFSYKNQLIDIKIIDFYRKAIINYIENEINNGDWLNKERE
jgi:hypothetical protein